MNKDLKLPPVLSRKRTPPTEPTSTLYVNGLNDSVNLKKLRSAMFVLFSNYNVRDVFMKKTLRLKGQAFIYFDNAKDASQAKEDVDGFLLLGRPMKISFTNFKSDCQVRRDGDDLSKHRAERKAEKLERRRIEREQMEKCREIAAKSMGSTASEASMVVDGTNISPINGLARDESPPNVTLFVENIPVGVDKVQLESIFSRFPGFLEVRVVPTKASIAFIDYASEMASSAAKTRTQNLFVKPTNSSLDGGNLSVTFAKKF